MKDHQYHRVHQLDRFPPDRLRLIPKEKEYDEVLAMKEQDPQSEPQGRDTYKACLAMGRECASLRLRRIERIVTRHYDSYLRPCGISAIQLPVLATIAVHEPLSLRDLAHFLQLDPSTLSRNLSLLRKRRLITMREGAGSRPSSIRLAVRGKGVLGKAIDAWQEAHRTLTEVMPGDAIGHALGTLSTVVDRLRDGSEL